VDDDESRVVVEQVVRDLVIAHATVQKGSIRNAIKALGQKRSPKTLIVDLCKSELPLSDVNELAEVCEPGVTVIAIGDRNDVGLFRELLNSGVSDYLVKPITPALVQRALLATADSDTGAARPRARATVATVGARGASVPTMLAPAWHGPSQPAAASGGMLDLDLQFGSVRFPRSRSNPGLREASRKQAASMVCFIER
jgi:pilus assembly protein CpaE